MAKSVLELAVETGKWDAGLKKAKSALDSFTEANGGLQKALSSDSDKMKQFVQMMGRTESTAKTAKGQMNDYKGTIEALTMQYNRMTDAQKSAVGPAYLQAIDQMKQRYKGVADEVAKINQELSGSKFGQKGHVIDTIGQQFGVTGNLTEMLTSKTALLTTALGGVASAAAYAAKEWAEYNSQLAKQDQITTVTTGLKGTDAEQMTSAMRALSRTYGADFRESVNAANTLMTQFGVTGSDAIQLLRDGMQGMILGDAPKLLSMIQQFAPSFHDAGVSASQLVAVIQNSEGGIFTDQNMQAIVMGIKNLRLMTKSTAEALAQLGIDGQKMSEKMSDGSITVFDALKQVAAKLKDVNSGSREAGEVMQAVFGRQGSIAGTNLAKAIETLNTDLETTKKQTGNLGDQMNELQKANERLEVSIRNCFGYDGWQTMANGIKTQLITALAGVIDVIDKIKNHTIVGNALSAQSTIFGTILAAAKSSLGPLADVWNILRKIKNLATSGSATGGSNKGVGYSDIENRINKIQSLDTREKRERGYNQLYQELQRKYQNVDRERYQDLGNGKGRFYIASDKTKAAERDALERRMKLLETRKESILEGKPIEQKVKVESDTTPTTTTTTTTTKQQTPKQRAQESFAKAEQSYKQALEQAAMELQAGTITRAEAKKKEMQAAEQRWKAIGDARNISDSDSLRQAQDEAAAEYKRLAAEAKTATEHQKAVDKATRDLENANQKLATARSEMAQARQQGDLQAYNTAKDKATAAQKEITRLEKVKVDVERGKVDLPDIPKEIEQIVNTHQGELMTADIATEITQKINTVLGNIVKPEILDEVTQTINTKVGNVITPEIAKEVTQVVNVDTGTVDLPDIPKEIEQIVNTHQGELMTADIATEITQKINTVLGNIVKPEILDEVTQTINTKVGKMITPEIAKEVTQVVNVETGTVDLKSIPTEMTTTVDFQANTRNIDAAISYVKKEIDTIPVGTIAFNLDQTKLADLTTLKTLIDEQVKNGLEIDPEATQGLFSKIQLGVDIEDTTWQELIDKINEKLKELDIKPVSINFKTGDTAKTGKETENAWKNAASAVQSVGSALQQIEDPSAKIAGIIGQAIANIALGFAQATAASSGGGIFAWIAAITGGVATMISTISAIHSTTGYADGGIVKGNRMSGDQVPAMLNSGELVLNKFQQQVLAANLQAGGLQGLQLEASVHAEQIRLALNNNGKRTGRGELVTWKR